MINKIGFCAMKCHLTFIHTLHIENLSSVFHLNQSITGRLFWTEILIIYTGTYNVIISINALKAMIKRDLTCIWVEKHVRAHVQFQFSRESFETHPDFTKQIHSVFTQYIIIYINRQIRWITIFVWTSNNEKKLLCWCFTALRHILGHFGRG